MNKETALFLGGVVVVYHLAAFVKDADAVQENVVRYRRWRTWTNLRRLVFAEGALIGDLGWLFG